MNEQGETLEEIIANIHLEYPDERVLRELLYTASESGIISTSIDLDDIEKIVKIYHLAVGYKDNLPKELRM